MSEESKLTLEKVINAIGEKLENAATLTVRTFFVTIDGDEGPTGVAAEEAFRNSRRPLALTEIKVDGDCESVLPMRKGEGGKLEIDDKLLGLHNDNVQRAREYRQDIMNTFIGLIRGR